MRCAGLEPVAPNPQSAATLLDVAGGSGCFAVHLVRREPCLCRPSLAPTRVAVAACVTAGAGLGYWGFSTRVCGWVVSRPARYWCCAARRLCCSPGSTALSSSCRLLFPRQRSTCGALWRRKSMATSVRRERAAHVPAAAAAAAPVATWTTTRSWRRRRRRRCWAVVLGQWAARYGLRQRSGRARRAATPPLMRCSLATSSTTGQPPSAICYLDFLNSLTVQMAFLCKSRH